jgi:hypothetical protein
MGASASVAEVERLLRGRRVARRGFVIGFFGAFGIFALDYALSGTYALPNNVFVVLFGSAWVTVVITGFILRFARCPRCGNKFAVNARTSSYSDFTDKCLNCGLRLDGTNAAEF